MNNTTTASPVDQDIGRVLHSVALLVVAVLICFSNVLIIVVYKKIHKKGDNAYRFILNLAVLDFLVGIYIGQSALIAPFPNLNTNGYFCFYRMQTLILLVAASQFTVTALSLDRYLIICHYSLYHKLHRKHFGSLTIALSWVFGCILFCLPLLYTFDFDSQQLCFYKNIHHSAVYLTNGIVFSSCIMADMIFYIQILRKAHQHGRRIGVASQENTESSRQSGMMIKKLRNAKITGFVTIVCIVCWVPNIVLTIRYGLGMKNESTGVAMIAVIFGICKSLVNPFVYAWQKPNFREKCLDLFRFKCAEE